MRSPMVGVKSIAAIASENDANKVAKARSFAFISSSISKPDTSVAAGDSSQAPNCPAATRTGSWCRSKNIPSAGYTHLPCPRCRWPGHCDISRPWSRNEEHTSELQSRFGISYAVFCLKKNNKIRNFTSMYYFINQLHNHFIYSHP